MLAVSTRMQAGLRDIRTAVRQRDIPPWHTMGGMLGSTFVIIQSYAVPMIGVAIFSVATIGGQTVMSMVVDRMGLRAGIKHHITMRRAITGFITVSAVLVTVSDRVSIPASSLAAPALGLLSGAGIAVQRALNAHVNDYAKVSFATTWWNFMTGCVMLTVMAVVMIPAGSTFSAPPMQSLWMYLGGASGVVYIAIANVVAQRMGVLLLTALSVGGQLSASLLFDEFFPSSGIAVGPNVYTGVALSLLGILVGVARRPTRASVGADDEE